MKKIFFLFLACFFLISCTNNSKKNINNSGTPPSAPGAPTITAGNSQLYLNWTAVSDATAYEVWYHTTDNSSAATQQGGDILSTSYTIYGLTNGTLYYVWLKAKNSSGTSGFGARASGTPIIQAPGYEPAGLGLVNYETGDLTQCSSYTKNGNDALSVISTGNPLDGTYCLKFVSGRTAVNTYAQKDFAPQTLVYARCTIYIDPFYSAEHNGGGISVLFGLYTAAGNPAITLGFSNDFAPYRLLILSYYDNSGGINKPVEETLSVGRHTFEVYYSYGAGTGTCGFIIDGKSWYSGTGLNNNNVIPTNVRVGQILIENGYADAGSIVYFDDIKIDTSYIDLYSLAIKDSQVSGTLNTNYPFGSQSINNYISTSFTAGSSYTLARVAVHMYNNSTGTPNLSLSLYSDDGSGNPSTLLATANNTINAADIYTYWPIAVLFSFNNYSIVSGTKYHLVLSVDAVLSNTGLFPLTNTSVAEQKIEQSATGTTFSVLQSNAQFNFQAYAPLSY